MTLQKRDSRNLGEINSSCISHEKSNHFYTLTHAHLYSFNVLRKEEINSKQINLSIVKRFNSFKINVLDLVFRVQENQQKRIEGGGDVPNWLFRQPKNQSSKLSFRQNQSSHVLRLKKRVVIILVQIYVVKLSDSFLVFVE